MVRPRITETVDALERAIRSAGVEIAAVSRVLLVGGSSRIPVVAQLVRERTGRPVAVDAHPKFAIATGAALLGAAATREQPAPVADPVGAAAGGPAPSTAGGSGVGLGVAAAGVGFAATAGVGAVVAGGTKSAAAATSSAAAVGVGPAGVSMAAGPAGVSMAAGPAGVPTAAGPSGIAAAAGPGGVPLAKAAAVAKAAARAPRRLPMVLGAVAGLAIAAGAVVVVSGGGGGSGGTTATTVTVEDETAAPVTSAPQEEATTTTVATVAGRGLAGLVELVAGNGSDNGLGVPGPAGDASLGNRLHFAAAPNGDVFVIGGAPVVLIVHDGTVEQIFTGDPAAREASFGGIAIGSDGDAYVTMGAGVKRISADGSSELVVDAQAEGLGGSFGPITVDGAGNLYFYDANTYRVLRRGVDGSLSHVAGTGSQATSGPAVGDGGPPSPRPSRHRSASSSMGAATCSSPTSATGRCGPWMAAGRSPPSPEGATC